MSRSRFVVVFAAGASVIVLSAAGAEAALTKSQQKCIGTQNRSLAKLSSTIGKELLSCIYDFSKEKDVTDISACLAADRNLKISAASIKVSDDYTRDCTGNDADAMPKNPGVLVTDDVTLIVAAMTKEESLLFDLFDSPSVALTETADESASKCQVAVAKSLKKCQDAKLKAFVACARSVLATGGNTAADLEACVLADFNGKIAKSCNETILPDGIRKALGKCEALGATVLATAFPQCPTSTVNGVHDCLETPVECITCKALNRGVAIAADCDLLDDGLVDQSCGCGDGILDFGEVCDANNLNGETCGTQGFPYGSLACSAICELDTSSCAFCSPPACPGYGTTAANVGCNEPNCTFSCQSENYDVDNSETNGCEVAEPTPGNHTTATPTVRPSVPCGDILSAQNISGSMASDQRTHENSSVTGFDVTSGSAPDYYQLLATGGTCFNDVAITLTVTGSSAPSCYKLSVQTNVSTYPCFTDGSGVCTASHGSGAYGDNTTVTFLVEKTCTASTIDNVTYTITGHL